jgi:sensor histidine kinase regulating citrate/malate metabolism
MEMKDKKLTKLTGGMPVVYTAVSLIAALIVSGGILYLLTDQKAETAETQFAMIFSALLVVFALVVSYVLLKTRSATARLFRECMALKEAIEETEELNNTLRSQRHDFLNHIQIIHGLMEIGEYDEAASYMEQIYNEIQAVTKILKTSSPAVNALLQVKDNSCENRGITFEIRSTTKLENPVMGSWDICAILGNLIDNAVNAVEGKKDGRVTVSLAEDISNYLFRVRDNGRGMDEKIKERIFEMGVSTKEGEGHGVGLAISKKKLAGVGGDIWFETGNGNTVFTFTVPKKPAG